MRRTWAGVLPRWFYRLLVAVFLVNIAGLVASVTVSSFGRQWFTGWLPKGYTTDYYRSSWNEYDLSHVMVITVTVAVVVAALAVIIGAPAAYVLARGNFPGKKLLILAFLLPLMLPPVTYGLPLATLLYRLGLGGHLSGVIVANLVPSVPLVVLLMIPYIQQLDTNLERAARSCGANGLQTVRRVLAPLLLPGILASGLLTLIHTAGSFELTFFNSGPGSETLVVALYSALWTPGFRPQQSIDAMSVIYMLTCLVLLFVALRFVSPGQIVTHSREDD
ncbi:MULTISPECIES: ABC transporter permease subunit [unclassified Streptomyces]|nr:ABC transporter permease [Streptomyces sp. CBMA29]